MISHPVHVKHSVHYIYDIIPTMYGNTILCVDYTTLYICMTSFALQKMSHPLYHTKSQSLWLHIHFRHDITNPVSDIAATVSLSSQPLHWYHTHFCIDSHPLYLWHHMHYIFEAVSSTWLSVVKGMLGPFLWWSGGLGHSVGSLQGIQRSFHLVIWTMSMHEASAGKYGLLSNQGISGSISLEA